MTALSSAAQPEFELAQKAAQNNDWDLSIIHLKRTIEGQPEYLPARLLLAEAQLRTGQSQAALTTLEVVRSLGGDKTLTAVISAAAYFQLGQLDLAKQVSESLQPQHLSMEWVSELLPLKMALKEYAWAEEFLSKLTADEIRQNPQFVLDQATLYYLTDRLDKARRVLRESVLPAELEHKVKLLSAEIFFAQGDLASAEAEYQQASARAATDLNVLMALSRFYLATNNRVEALKYSQSLVEAHPQHPVGQLLHAAVLKQAGDEDGVSAVIQELNFLLSGLTDEHRLQRNVLLFRGLYAYFNTEWVATRERMETYLSLYSFDDVANKLLIKACLQLNDLACAEQRLEQALKVGTLDKNLIYLGLNVYRLSNELDLAISLAEKAQALFPDDQELALSLVSLYQLTEKPAQAYQLLQELGREENSSTKVLLSLGYMHLQNDNLQLATETANQLLVLAPNKVESFLLAAEIAVKHGELALAEQFIAQSLQLSPNYKPALLISASLALSTANYQQAESIYKQLLRQNFQDQEIKLLLAGLYKQQKQWLLATEQLEQLLQLHANNDMARGELVALLLKQGDNARAFEVSQQFTANHLSSAALLQIKLKAELITGAFESAKRTLSDFSALAFDDQQLMLDVANYYLQLNDIRRAKAALKRLQYLDRELTLVIPTLHLQGLLALKENDYNSLRSTVSALNQRHAFALVLELKSYAAIKQGREAAAINSLKALIKQRPAKQFYYLLADAQIRNEAGKEAELTLSDWLQIDGSDTEARLRLAAMMQKRGAKSEAIAVLEAAQQNDVDPRLLNNLANLYLPEHPQAALEYANKAVDAAPNVAAYLDTFGWALIQNGQWELGLENIRQAIVRESTNPEYYYHLTDVLIKLGKIRQAKAAYQELRKLDKQHTFSQHYQTLEEML